MSLSIAHIRAAHDRIRDKINRTPVLTSETLDAAAKAHLYFKCENFQKAGVFKSRGAVNAVFSLTDIEARNGVVTHSSGNHAAAIARAAKLRGIPAYIVMHNNAPKAKAASVRRYGGEVIPCEPIEEARQRASQEVIARTGAAFVHPYNDLRVMAGQGTTALEFLEAVPELDLLLCPVGGGGHLSGVAVAAKSLKPSIQVVGVEPAEADDAARSFKAGEIFPSDNPKTIADGLLTALGDKTFAEIQRYVDDIITVSEDAIVTAMRTLWEIMKIIVEPSGAVPFAAVQSGVLHVKDRKVGVIVSGGNLDLDKLPWQT
jgi:threonine dehydratase